MHRRLGHLGGPLILALALLLGCTGAEPSAQAAPAGACPAPFNEEPLHSGWNRGLSVEGQERDVWAILPEPGTPSPHPLLIAFNGTTEDGRRFSERARLTDFARRGFVVLAPSSAGNGSLWPVWDAMRPDGEENAPNKDVALFDALLGCATSLDVDPMRVYVAGHSAGGIFVNALLQRRSHAIAGAIVGSGVLSNTSPVPLPPLDPAFVLVTWGGDNDQWSGRAGGVSVRNFSFAAESSNASRFWASQPDYGVISCVGDGLGHAWLDGLNGWMIDQLLAHPKGQSAVGALPTVPAGARATCTAGPVILTPSRTLSCPASTSHPYCQDVCQLMADGAVLNSTVYPVLHRELDRLGFGDAGGCDGCVRACEAAATQPADALALACFHAAPDADPTVQGISGARPLTQAINTCCDGNQASGFCQELCGEMKGNLAVRGYVPVCRDQF